MYNAFKGKTGMKTNGADFVSVYPAVKPWKLKLHVRYRLQKPEGSNIYFLKTAIF
jgi:hypothetical protein